VCIYLSEKITSPTHKANFASVIFSVSVLIITGPALQSGIYLSALVQDPQGGVILIGGFSRFEFLDTIYRLNHSGQLTYDKFFKKRSCYYFANSNVNQ